MVHAVDIYAVSGIFSLSLAHSFLLFCFSKIKEAHIICPFCWWNVCCIFLLLSFFVFAWKPISTDQLEQYTLQCECVREYELIQHSLACCCYYCVWKKNILFMVNIACMICMLCVLFSSREEKPYEFTCAKDFSHRPAISASFFFTD